MPKPKKRRITAEDLYNFKLITGLMISPDGGHVVFSLQRVDRKTEKKCSNLWVVPTRGGRPRQFTAGMVSGRQMDRLLVHSSGRETATGLCDTFRWR